MTDLIIAYWRNAKEEMISCNRQEMAWNPVASPTTTINMAEGIAGRNRTEERTYYLLIIPTGHIFIM